MRCQQTGRQACSIRGRYYRYRFDHEKVLPCDLYRQIVNISTYDQTFFTPHSLLKYLNDQIKPASVRVASLVEKRTHKASGFKADYVGFSIPDVFVVGYCLDFNEVYRDLKHLAIVNETGYLRFRDHEY